MEPKCLQWNETIWNEFYICGNKASLFNGNYMWGIIRGTSWMSDCLVSNDAPHVVSDSLTFCLWDCGTAVWGFSKVTQAIMGRLGLSSIVFVSFYSCTPFFKIVCMQTFIQMHEQRPKEARRGHQLPWTKVQGLKLPNMGTGNPVWIFSKDNQHF